MHVRREAAMQEGLQRAVGVPLSLAERISLLWPSLKEMVAFANIACKSDAQVRNTYTYMSLEKICFNMSVVYITPLVTMVFVSSENDKFRKTFFAN